MREDLHHVARSPEDDKIGMSTGFRCVVLAALLACQWVLPVRAEEYPERPVTMIVSFAPGGITDVMARAYADVVSRNIGQRIVVENRSTGAGTVAAASVQQSAPDGYTLLVFAGAQNAVVPAMQPVGYDPVNGFAPVTVLFNLVNFLVVPQDSPAKTLGELLQMGRTKPGGLSAGTAGVGTTGHLTAVRLGLSTKTPIQAVQYRGGAPMLADLLAGRLDFALLAYNVIKGQVASGKLRLLAVDAEKRWPDTPDVPTLSEAGVHQPAVASWFALAAPAGTPAAIVQKIHDAFVKASQDPELTQRARQNGALIVMTSPAKLHEMMTQEMQSTGGLVRQLGLRPQ
jgi:tripartite-type tricarboxylate transporter receptor subunit TctC